MYNSIIQAWIQDFGLEGRGPRKHFLGIKIGTKMKKKLSLLVIYLLNFKSVHKKVCGVYFFSLYTSIKSKKSKINPYNLIKDKR